MVATMQQLIASSSAPGGASIDMTGALGSLVAHAPLAPSSAAMMPSPAPSKLMLPHAADALDHETQAQARAPNLSARTGVPTPKRTSPVDGPPHMSSDAGYLASVQSSEIDMPPAPQDRPLAQLVRPVAKRAMPGRRSETLAAEEESALNWNSDLETDFESGPAAASHSAFGVVAASTAGASHAGHDGEATSPLAKVEDQLERAKSDLRGAVLGSDDSANRTPRPAIRLSGFYSCNSDTESETEADTRRKECADTHNEATLTQTTEDLARVKASDTAALDSWKLEIHGDGDSSMALARAPAMTSAIGEAGVLDRDTFERHLDTLLSRTRPVPPLPPSLALRNSPLLQMLATPGGITTPAPVSTPATRVTRRKMLDESIGLGKRSKRGVLTTHTLDMAQTSMPTVRSFILICCEALKAPT
nr:hypothetical protein HK105_000145 [Polyrhizophydium stewartii]